VNIINKHFSNIIKANCDKRFAIFVGAGISKSSESDTIKLPSWNDLINDLKNDLLLQPEENDFLKIAQLYYLEYKEFTYYEKIKGYFPADIEPSVVHKLIFEINAQSVITTNWDTILEKTIDTNSYIYDVVSSDEDLVKLTLQKKLIKMHGDFKKHNIVFKEDDYLSYSFNFPLVENYIKSILSTHTVLFIGYSYNDINLKHIMKWLQNHSKVSPPRYLIAFEHNSTQIKYLENHGITVLVISEQDIQYKHLDKYSQKMATFLNKLINPDAIFNKQNDDEIIAYIYDKLKILDNLDFILLDQIRRALTNCGFIYTTDGLVLLQFYTEFLTADFNEDKRNVFGYFIEVIKRYDKGEYQNNDIDNIFRILSKANISGIIISKDTDTDNAQYVHQDNPTKEKILPDTVDESFNFCFHDSFARANNVADITGKAYRLYQISSYENAYANLEDAISVYLKQRNYTQLFLSMFNRNIVLRSLRHSFCNETRQKFQAIGEYDLNEKFHNLPTDLQKVLEPIYRFVNYDYLLRYAFDISVNLKEFQNSQKIIERGGSVYRSNVTEPQAKHENLLFFVIANKMMIDHNLEYRTINKYFIEIAIVRQMQKQFTCLNKVELYSCIKYIKNDELIHMLEKFYSGKSDTRPILRLNDADAEWLIEKVLPNIGNLFIHATDAFNTYGEWLQNAILIFSIVEINQLQSGKIMSIFQLIISEAKNTIGVYESINRFLGLQYKLYKLDIDSTALIGLIDILIRKIIYNKSNGYDYQAITHNYISNLYGYVENRKAIYQDYELVTKMLAELKSRCVTDLMQISQSFLLSLYDISSPEIRNNIRSFILDIDVRAGGDSVEVLIFELTLIAKKFKKYNGSIVTKLSNYLKQFEGSKRFSIALYTVRYLLDFLVNEMAIIKFEILLSKLQELIQNYESREKISIF
jgi:hypothetical protein